MNSVICTLYEGHYHHGIAALVNSLYRHGFRGSFYVGYRGDLPTWAKTAKENPSLNWEGSKSLTVTEGLVLHFLPVTTSVHLTNYKSDFMLQLWNGVEKNANAMFYFDPDIVVKCKFSFFETWVNYGVALVHEISANDMTYNNPVRAMWKKIIEDNGEKVNHQITSYINAGFFGLKKEDTHFIEMFNKFTHISIEKFNVDVKIFDLTDRTDPFFAKDQDALNIAAMCTTAPLSEIGPEGMGFIHGGFTMAHAIGSPKPWKKNFLSSSLSGNPPSLAEKEFWNNVGFPINTFSDTIKKQKKISIKVASFLGRFYRKH